MTFLTSRRGRHPVALLALLTITLVPGLTQLPALADDETASPAIAPTPIDGGTLGDPVDGLLDVDERGTTTPAKAQRQAVSGLGAIDVRWNDFGTPASLLPADGSLAPAPGKPAQAAQKWIQKNATLLGLSSEQVAGLEMVNNQKLASGGGNAVLFRQTFGDLTPAIGSMVTVGVADGQIAYVSSSLTKTTDEIADPALDPLEGWLKAAESVDLGLDSGAISDIGVKAPGEDPTGWTRLNVPGLAQQQQARVRALAGADGSVRPVIEANVVNSAGGSVLAYTALVDAVEGTILYRENKVENSNDAQSFTGAITATDCGPMHELTTTDDLTKTITVGGAAVNPANDIVVKIFDTDGELLTSADTGTSPEIATVSDENGFPEGTYSAQVCPFDSPTVPFVAPGDYVLGFTTSDVAGGTGGGGGGTGGETPRWRFFTANPTPASAATTEDVPTGSVIGCWFIQGGPCDLPTGYLRNVQAFGPWDDIGTTGVSSGTTLGNNASTREAWLSPLTPGGGQAPTSAERQYTEEFTDAWNNSQCDPAQLTPGGNDINASVTNLFSTHNRMHDYSYYLGFDERNYNMQTDNAGRRGVDGDPEIGNAQAGAISGGSAGMYLGRDNANQITLQDGIPGITNQYLFQPIAGAFYAPCTDGGLDMGIVGHEYTHAISNRMVGGPDEGLTSNQGGAMGESWSDLVAAEYQFGHGYDNGGNTFAVGLYATGNKDVAIRDYAINKNPLNYSDYGFDTTGDEVHADGEIWNGTNFEVRQALVNKWNAAFPYNDKKLQLNCSQATRRVGVFRAQQCPGNRRWIQLMFDAFLLQQGATSMLDARDAFIAADQMRFRGENRSAIWNAFARRGMGKGASTPDADSGDVTASFASPTSANTKVTFDTAGSGKIYVGDYEARVTPVADTLGSTDLGDKASFTPGTYKMLYVSKKRGFQRFTMTVTGQGSKTVKVAPAENLAAAVNGAEVIGTTEGSRNEDSLIDGTEQTNWAGVTEENVDETNPSVTVDLAGGTHEIRTVKVSAMLTPAPASDTDVPLVADPDSGSRFTALRKFAVEACVSSCNSSEATWKRVYVSANDAFPSERPRPVAPNLTMRTFQLDKTVTASALRLVTLENQCTGFAGYAGEQDNDPLNDTDCKTASDRGTIVHAAEFQAFGS